MEDNYFFWLSDEERFMTIEEYNEAVAAWNKRLDYDDTSLKDWLKGRGKIEKDALGDYSRNS